MKRAATLATLAATIGLAHAKAYNLLRYNGGQASQRSFTRSICCFRTAGSTLSRLL